MGCLAIGVYGHFRCRLPRNAWQSTLAVLGIDPSPRVKFGQNCGAPERLAWRRFPAGPHGGSKSPAPALGSGVGTRAGIPRGHAPRTTAGALTDRLAGRAD